MIQYILLIVFGIFIIHFCYAFICRINFWNYKYDILPREDICTVWYLLATILFIIIFVLIAAIIR